MGDTKVTTIPALRRVFSATYANLPTTGLAEEDLGYATDRLSLYRWSGAAWVAITIYASSGTAAAIPAAANLPAGSLYFETDTGILKQVQAGAWVALTGKVSSSGNYTGNDGANRAIPHGLGRIPNGLIIVEYVTPNVFKQSPPLNGNIFRWGSTTMYTVSILDATSFYVGHATSYVNSANGNAKVYMWVAF